MNFARVALSNDKRIGREMNPQTLSPAMMASMFFKLKLQVGVHKGSVFPPDRAAEFLQRASQLGPQLGFEWVFVDKPTGGSFGAVENRNKG